MSARSFSAGSTLAIALALVPLGSADAAPAEGEAGASISADPGGVDGDASGKGRARKRDKRPFKESWIRRHRPRRMHGELGVFGGVFLPSRGLALYEDDTSGTHYRYDRAGADFGLRGGFYPLSFLGIEAEGSLVPIGAEGESVLVYGVRGGLVLQLPLASIVPFATVGGGFLGVAGADTRLGTDLDGSFHIGAGVKVWFHHIVGLRFDARTHLSEKGGPGDPDRADSEELLLSLAIRLGQKPAERVAEEPPKDSDNDGFFDPEDACPQVAGVAPDGCPVKDTDGDGFFDPEDACVDTPGVAPDGCPIGDKDGDGITDDVDECPDEAGDPPSGCPPKDSDGDGILDADDLCVNEPETFNEFEDADGCPDQIPDEVSKFTGTIKGITFETDKAKIRPASKKVLDEAVEVLKKYPELRVRVAGHTDSRGNREYNVDLSERRAKAVKQYLVDNGVDASRLETRGAGPDEPIASNSSKEGRADNRRIDFEPL